jgi:hypothetical protein
MLQFSGQPAKFPHRRIAGQPLHLEHSFATPITLVRLEAPDQITVNKQRLVFRVVRLTPWVYPLYAVIFCESGMNR